MQDWFYHAPTKRELTDGPVDYPAPSQIPGLSDVVVDDRDEDGVKRGYFRESDSKYVRLCKQGGRKDLLRFNSPKNISKEPVPYPRADWFYPDEEVKQETSPRKILVPEYMVYGGTDQQDGDEKYQPRHPPFSLQDNMTVFERDGDVNPTDKTLRLPEIKRPNKKHKFKSVKQDNLKVGAQHKFDNSDISGRKKFPPIKKEMDPVILSKLLSMGYQSDWLKKRDVEEERFHQKFKQDPLAPVVTKAKTEYREGVERAAIQAAHEHKPSKHAHTDRTEKRAKKAENKLDSSLPEKEMFKLSKFNKVGSKVDTGLAMVKSKSDLTHLRHPTTVQVNTYLDQVETYKKQQRQKQQQDPMAVENY